MTDVKTDELIRSSYINPIGDLTLNKDHQTIQQRLDEASEKDDLKRERDKIEKLKADVSKRTAELKSKEESLDAQENSLKSREIALNSNLQSLQKKIDEHKKNKRKDEQDAKKEIDDRNKISEELNERSRSLNQQEADLKEESRSLDQRSRELDSREKRLEIREVIANQNSLGVKVLESKLTEIESRLTEGFLEIDEKIDSITLPQKKKPTKEKSNDNQIDFLSDKQNISLPEDYVFVLQNGEELGQCENLQSFISGIGRAKITGNIDDFLTDFNFYFNDEGEPFFEVNITELHENTQKDLFESFLKNT